VGGVKTEYSRDCVPLAPELAAELLAYRDRCYMTQDGWLFANPATDRPYHQEESSKQAPQKGSQSSGHHNQGRLEDLPAQLPVVA
jgi:hypothetical protein